MSRLARSCDPSYLANKLEPTVLGWGKLANVQWHNHGSTAYTESNDESAHSELSERVCGRLEDRSDDEDNTSCPDGHLSSEAIGCKSSSNLYDISAELRYSVPG
jgi:hypothetical protein